MDRLNELRAIVGESNVLTAEADVAGYLVDWSNRFHGKTPAVVRPANTEEVSKVLAWANATGTAVVPQSGNTSLVGGGTPSPEGKAILLSLSRMNKVEEIDVVNDTMTLEAGVILEKAQQAAKGTTDGRQPLVGQWGLLNSRCGKVADDGDAGNGCDAKRCKIHEFFLLCIRCVGVHVQKQVIFGCVQSFLIGRALARLYSSVPVPLPPRAW